MTAIIRPVETVYDGYRFRSRLEARWAVFFKSLGVRYEYEPEGFMTEAGPYLPDFRVTCCAKRGGDCRPFPLYIEVKGRMDAASAARIKAFSHYNAGHDRGRQALLIVGDVPDIRHAHDIFDSRATGSYDTMGFGLYPMNYETVDGDHFAAYPCVDDGRFGLLGDDLHYIEWGDHLRTAYSYIAARRARFEHGEQPVTAPVDGRGRLRLLKAQEMFGAII